MTDQDWLDIAAKAREEGFATIDDTKVLLSQLELQYNNTNDKLAICIEAKSINLRHSCKTTVVGSGGKDA